MGVITISPESWDVYYSYGNSPAMEYVSSAGIVNLKGVLGVFSNVYNFSYGKSPITDDSMGALQVWINGMTLENYRNMVAGSYGVIVSPATDDTHYVWRIHSSGDVDKYYGYDDGFIGNSYGLRTLVLYSVKDLRE